jgi:hypothetical protein
MTCEANRLSDFFEGSGVGYSGARFTKIFIRQREGDLHSACCLKYSTNRFCLSIINEDYERGSVFRNTLLNIINIIVNKE